MHTRGFGVCTRPWVGQIMVLLIKEDQRDEPVRIWPILIKCVEDYRCLIVALRMAHRVA